MQIKQIVIYKLKADLKNKAGRKLLFFHSGYKLDKLDNVNKPFWKQ